ncbi:hypothetical protein [Parabacteroides pacaensis]|uniref:hypothetical protein n=1 Tax=Parabacteroides pacaensis TaxID=2086575 RepID=UPI000D105FD2|nr:hypothetical protein [Parabacteroides pacaensis]
MKAAHDNLDKLKEKSPFTIPTGYMEGITEQIMSQLPEHHCKQEAQKIIFVDKIKPLLYMAAMFAGLGLFFKFFLGTPDTNKNSLPTDSLLVQSTNITVPSFYTTSEEDAEYLDYVEEQCSNYLLEGEVDF